MVPVAEQALLRLSSLSVAFRHGRRLVPATSDLSLELRPGQVLGVVGESGSGKSVTVRAMLGLLPAGARVTSGSLSWRGRELDLTNPRAVRRLRGVQLGFVPQDPFGALNPRLSVRNQFRAVLKLAGTAARDADPVAADALRRVGIAHAEDVLRRYPFELSGGMAQRVVIALTLMRGPQVLLADEPTTGLDSTVQRQVLDLMTSLVGTGRTEAIILVTHDLGVVARYCADVVVIYHGEAVEAGPVGQILRHAGHPYTRELIGALSAPGPDGAAR